MCFLCFCFRAGTLAVEHTASPSDYSLSALQELIECRQTAPGSLEFTKHVGLNQTGASDEETWKERDKLAGERRVIHTV